MSLQIVERPQPEQNEPMIEMKDHDEQETEQKEPVQEPQNETVLAQEQENQQQEQEDTDTEETELSQEVAERGIPVKRGDFIDATTEALTNLDFQRRAFGTGTGLIIGEMVGEGVRVTTGQTGLGGLLIKGAGRVGTGITALWLGSMLPGDLQLLAEDIAIGSWGGFLVNITNFASAGSPTTDLGATSQFAASMGARLRAAQMSSNQRRQTNQTQNKRRGTMRRGANMANQDQETGNQTQQGNQTSRSRRNRTRR